MKIQIQPPLSSCLATSLAMLLNEDVNNIIIEIGHNDERGFHVQELIKICLKRGIALLQFDMDVNLIKDGTDVINFGSDKDYIDDLMKNNDGILLGSSYGNGKSHAVAWNHIENCIYDPNGSIYAKGFYSIESFLLLRNLK
jgi:hypothetical protein